MEENDPLLKEIPQNQPINDSESEIKGVCRICLEDDVRSNLEEPCSCKGTTQFAHHACLQRWINERDQIGQDALICEICKQRYTGQYTIPPPRPPPRNNNNDRVVVLLIDPETGIPRPIVTNSDALGEDDYEEYQERMRPATACCVTFILFMFCSLLLTHLFNLPQNPPPGEVPELTHDDAEFEDVSATLLLLWLMMRLIVIVAPVYTLNQFLMGRYHRAMMNRRGGAADAGQEMQIVVHSVPEVGSSGSQATSTSRNNGQPSSSSS